MIDIMFGIETTLSCTFIYKLKFMKKSLFASVILMGVILSCNSNKEKDPEVADTNIAKETTIHCYQKVLGQDTMLLTLNKTGLKITGSLIYDFYEKDKSEGMLAGEQSGDTLIAEYVFKSEGKESKREIAFLLKEVDLVEGYGEMVEKGDLLKFKTKSGINFKDTVYYKNVPCPAQ